MNEKLIEVMARAEYEHAWGNGAHWPPHNPQIHAKFIRRAHAVLTALQSAGYVVVPVEPTHTHRKGGWYFKLGVGRIQSDTPLQDMDEVVIYKAGKDGSLWARKRSEFEDGRFTAIEAAK